MEGRQYKLHKNNSYVIIIWSSSSNNNNIYIFKRSTISLLIFIIKDHPHYNTITSMCLCNCHISKRKEQIGLHPCYRQVNWGSGKLEAPQLVRVKKKKKIMLKYPLNRCGNNLWEGRRSCSKCQDWDSNPISSDSKPLCIFHCVMLPASLFLSPN